MEEDKQQKELFEFEPPKRSFPRLGAIFPRSDFEGKLSVTLTLERLIFILIGIIMLMVIIYALGVEAGRSTAKAKAPAIVPAKNAVAAHAPVIPAKQNITPREPVVVTSPAVVPVKDVNKPYTIVAVTFSKRELAVQEVNKLKKSGFSATLVQSDSYFQVCVGSYSDKNGAESQKDLKKIKRLYKDAYFRLI